MLLLSARVQQAMGQLPQRSFNDTAAAAVVDAL
jgi:hypothetical protein